MNIKCWEYGPDLDGSTWKGKKQLWQHLPIILKLYFFVADAPNKKARVFVHGKSFYPGEM